MNDAVLSFLTCNIFPADVCGKHVLEVGSMDVNGSPRSVILPLKPARYLGVDVSPGNGVDLVCDASQLTEKVGREKFDLVLSTEMVEHVRDWRGVFLELKRAVAPGGLLAVTTRSPGFKYHAYPNDHWRYTPDHMRSIFSDMDIIALESDPCAPGVFVLARRKLHGDVIVPNVDLYPADASVLKTQFPRTPLTLITFTRDRADCFGLCQRWMRAQDFQGPQQWLVVDDGDVPARLTMGQERIRRAPSAAVNTLPDNALAAVPHVRGEKCLIIEDDDWYPSKYVSEMVRRLNTALAAGEIRARYYNVAERRWGVGGNTAHASLCRTAFQKELLPHLERAAQACRATGDISVDLKFWQYALSASPGKADLFEAPKLSVSIKGMPGRPGLGRSHRSGGLANADSDLAVLRSWVGAEVSDVYAVFKRPSA